MMKSKLLKGAIGLGCLLVASNVSAAETWIRAAPEYRRLGVQTLVCKDIPEQLVCLGLGCAAGKGELVSIRSGSGAFEGLVKMKATTSVDVNFSRNDDALAALAGASASRASLTPEQVDAMLAAARVEIRDPRDGGFSETYSTRGLGRHVRSGATLCRKP